MKLNTPPRDFKGNTPEEGAEIGVLSKKKDIGTDFDKFREKQKGYVERKFDNAKDVMCVVTYMEDLMEFFNIITYRMIYMKRKQSTSRRRKY